MSLDEPECEGEFDYEFDDDDYGPDFWGPILWRAFHTAAEFSNLSGTRELWPMLVAALEAPDGIPCPECSGHFRDWCAKHPYDISTQTDLEDVRTYTRAWFLNLHNNVNRHAEPPTAEWNLDQLRTTYGPPDMATKIAAVNAELHQLDELVGDNVLTHLRALLHQIALVVID